MDKGAVWGGVSSTDEGTVMGMSAPRMRRVAWTVVCAVTHVLLEQVYQVDVVGTMVVVRLWGMMVEVCGAQWWQHVGHNGGVKPKLIAS